MKYFWYDHRGTDKQPSNETFVRLVNIFKAEYRGTPDDLPVDESFICFVHHGGKIAWESKGNPSKGQFIGILSFGGDPCSKKTENDGVILLPKSGLNRGLPIIERKPNNLLEFKKSAEQGKPMWALLKPHLGVEYLIAFYLLLVAKDNGLALTINTEMRQQAYEECKELVKLLDWHWEPDGVSAMDNSKQDIKMLLQKGIHE